MQTAKERLLNEGYEGIKVLDSYSYDSALIGVSEQGCAIYDYDKMVRWLMDAEGWDVDEAIEWIDLNTIRALSYMGEGAPIIMYPLLE